MSTNGLTVKEMVHDVMKEFHEELKMKKIIDEVKKKYGKDVKESTIRQQTAACTVNHYSRIHHSFNQKTRNFNPKYDLFFSTDNGGIDLYDSQKHGEWGIVEKKGKFNITHNGKIVDKSDLNQFYFVERDFESTVPEKKEGQYLDSRFKELHPVLKNNLSPFFDDSDSYVGAARNHWQNTWKKNHWIGFIRKGTQHFQNQKDSIQFQTNIDDEAGGDLSIGIWLDGTAKNARPYALKKIGQELEEFEKQLRSIPNSFFIGIKLKNKTEYEEEISKVDDEFIQKFIKDLSKNQTEFYISRYVSKDETLNYETKILDEISETFDKLIPITEFLGISNNTLLEEDSTKTGTTQTDDKIADEKMCSLLEKKGYFELLKKEKQIIFYGPPGTGKTFTAKKMAKCFTNTKEDGITPDEFIEKIIDELKTISEFAGYTFEKKGSNTQQKMFLLKKEGDEIRVDFHMANTDYFQVNAGTKFLTENPRAKNYLVLTKESEESFVCLPYEVEQKYSEFVSEGDGTGGWDATGKGKHSVHNLKINSTEAHFEPKKGETAPHDVSKYLNTWNPLNQHATYMTFSEAAREILLREGKEMHYKEITRRALGQGLIQSDGNTPWNSLLRDMSEDVRITDSTGTFQKISDGVYGLTDYTQKNNFGKSNRGRNIFHVTFHPSYSYEDFIEGFRPNVGAGSTTSYVLDDGIFKIACEHARKNKSRKTVLVIDEINRGNIPKIFGELISLIENSYRGRENTLKLAYSKDDFFVPENLYLIGTMNTADKSLVQMDEALRRRFAFLELMPEPDLLDGRTSEKYKDIMEKINAKIVNTPERMKQYRDRQIGHTYFWNLKNDEDLRFMIKYKIIPLLQDYFYDDYGEIREILGTKIIGNDNRPGSILDKESKESLADEIREHLSDKPKKKGLQEGKEKLSKTEDGT
jgi:MoxR-like ATPase